MDFETWVRLHCPMADEHERNMLEFGYKAGWDQCRDKWGGLQYTMTEDLNLFLDAGE